MDPHAGRLDTVVDVDEVEGGSRARRLDAKVAQHSLARIVAVTGRPAAAEQATQDAEAAGQPADHRQLVGRRLKVAGLRNGDVGDDGDVGDEGHDVRR